MSEWRFALPDSAGTWERELTGACGEKIITSHEVQHGKRGLEIFIHEEWKPVDEHVAFVSDRWRKI